MTNAFGCFRIRRLPRRPRELLQGWDAADEYLLDWLAAENLPASTAILLANDGFGALAVALQQYQLQSWSDSWLAQQATRDNLQTNGLSQQAFVLFNSLQLPQAPLDMVVIKPSKNLALLEYQLLLLKPLLRAGSRVVIGGMLKNLTPTVWKLLERIIGPTETSLARKKARLIFATPDMDLSLQANPYPSVYSLPAYGLEISNHANVFSRERLDIGTTFFLQHLPGNRRYHSIIDLACGNGVVGVRAAQLNPQARLKFIDESFMAVDSARLNFNRAFGNTTAAEFRVSDSLTDCAPASADLVLCNPPFHQQHAVSDWIALRMFEQSARVLNSEGELWVVGNRHLGYHHKLKRWFAAVELVASNRKFVILKASRPRQTNTL